MVVITQQQDLQLPMQSGGQGNGVQHHFQQKKITIFSLDSLNNHFHVKEYYLIVVLIVWQLYLQLPMQSGGQSQGYDVKRDFQQYFNHIVLVSFIGGENRSTQRKPLTCCKSLTNPMQSVPITTKVVSLNPSHGEVYSIQHYMIKFVSDLLQVSVYLWVL